MLTLEMLQADHGDCLWIECTEGQSTYRILIDGGTPSTYPRLKKRIEALPESQRHIDLFVVTHIDSDHIGGAVKLLEKPPAGLSFGDVWFNGFKHLPRPDDQLGVAQALKLTEKLENGQIPWNQQFRGNAVVVPEEGVLAPVMLTPKLALTVLSPGLEQLRKLYPKWNKEMEKLRLKQSEDESRPGPEDQLGQEINVTSLANSVFKEDFAEPNGSSIAMLVEYGGRRILLGADAHPHVLSDSIGRLPGDAPKLKLDAYKVAHHGSKANTSKKLLLQLDCKRYLISTNGNQFHHPDKEAIARIIQFGRPESILFNYESQHTSPWRKDKLQNNHRYQALFESKVSLTTS